jgi:hypothetical protein
MRENARSMQKEMKWHEKKQRNTTKDNTSDISKYNQQWVFTILYYNQVLQV